MNNIDTAIKIMKRARDAERGLDMNEWQSRAQGPHVRTEVAATCGTVCCFAGWVALSPEWQADPTRRVSLNGMPQIITDECEFATAKWLGSDAIAEWLDIDTTDAKLLCEIETCSLGYIYSENPTFDEVIKNLEILKAGGSLKPLAEDDDS